MSEMKRPTAEQMAKFKKNANDSSLSAEVRAKFQAIVDKFENVTEEIGEDVVKEVEPAKKRGRKPRATSTTKTTKTTKTKQSATDVEKAKAEIKKRTGKTEEECESIIEEYRSLRTKAQEGKRKAEQASADNKKRVDKLENKGDLIEGTNVKTADAVIETTAKDVAEKIEQQIEAVEEKAEKEAKAEVAKDKTIKTPKSKKEAVEKKVDEKVKKETKVVVQRVVIDTSALLTSIATTLGKFDKDSQKEFLIKLRSDIDKLLSKYAFGGLTNGATQTMNITQSNLSASSVNPTLFAKGGGIMADGRIVLRTFNGVGGNKNKTYKLIKDDRDSDGKPYYTLIEDQSGNVMAQGDSFDEVNGYANLMSGKFSNGGGVDGKDLRKLILKKFINKVGNNKDEFVTKYGTLNGDYENLRLSVNVNKITDRQKIELKQWAEEVNEKEFLDESNNGEYLDFDGLLDLSKESIISLNQILNNEFDKKDYYFSYVLLPRGYDFYVQGISYEVGGEVAEYKVGDNVRYLYNNRVETGEIVRRIDDESVEVRSGFSSALVNDRRIVGLAPKKRFSFFEHGGGIDGNDYSGEYESLGDFVRSNEGMRKMLSAKYNIPMSEVDDNLNGELGYDEEVIKNLLRGKGYSVKFIDNKNDGYFKVTKRKMAKGGLTEHGLREGDKIIFDHLVDDNIDIIDGKGKKHIVDLDKGKRYAKGGNVSSMLRNRRGM